MLAVAFAAFAAGLGTPAAESAAAAAQEDADPLAPTVRVEFDRPLEDAAPLTGFLHALGPTAPDDDLITPLAPATWRGAWRADSPQYERIRGFGSNYLFVLSDQWGYPTGPVWDGRGAPYDDFDAWEAFVREEAEGWRGFPVTIDIWNEPDVLGVFWSGTLEQFVETWVRASVIITEVLGPEAEIAGASTGAYDPIYTSALVDACATHEGCRMTTLTWHELIGPVDQIALHLRDARDRYLDSDAGRAIGLQRMMIPEYVGAGRQYSPGIHLGALAQLQAGGADGAALACWGLIQVEEEENECGGPILDGLLTPIDHKPRAPWWVHELYAAGEEHAVSVTADAPQVAGLATADAGDGQVQVLVGRYDTGDPFPGFNSPVLDPEPVFAPTAPPVQDVAVELSGLASVGVADGPATVTIERLPYNGREPLPEPVPVDEVTVDAADGNARLVLAAVPTHDVVVLSIQPGAQTPIEAQPESADPEDAGPGASPPTLPMTGAGGIASLAGLLLVLGALASTSRPSSALNWSDSRPLPRCSAEEKPSVPVGCRAQLAPSDGARRRRAGVGDHAKAPVARAPGALRRRSAGVDAIGFEPTTPSLRTRCSARLSHAPEAALRSAAVANRTDDVGQQPIVAASAGPVDHRADGLQRTR